ncbi:MAG: hexapeptide transferase [Bacteroidales bacterium]|nr:hexapeptide transferase [Bacteroidales bacterium]
MYAKRIIYFFYYLKDLDWSKFFRFLRIARVSSGKTSIVLLFDIVVSSLRYNISILDYFYFGFYVRNSLERSKWAGTGYMYEFQLHMNPRGVREILENKILFLNTYSVFVRRRYIDIDKLAKNKDLLIEMLANTSGRLVLKYSRGQIGKEVEVIDCPDFTPDRLLKLLKGRGYDLVEEYVVQHPSLMQLSPSGLNTVRIFTQVTSDSVEIIGARLRVSVNSPVDNMAAGNIAVPVDILTGLTNGPGVYSDITKTDCSIHPVTKQSVVNFQIPFWNEVLDFVKKAAMSHPENRSVGWDIAITADGPELIEGNHNWCKLLLQLPVKRGMKAELDCYL